MARTTQDLATEAMRLLGLLEAQEEASAEDRAHISRVYADKYEEWVFRDLAWWPVDEIDNKAFQHVARIIADEVAPSFGRSAPQEQDENGDVVSMGVKGLRGIRRLAASDRTGMPIRADYY